MKESSLSPILRHLAEEHVPLASVDLWPAIKPRFKTSKTHPPKGVPIMKTSFAYSLRLAAALAIIILLLVVVFLLTPQGRAWAPSVLHLTWPQGEGLFPTTEATSFPLNPTERADYGQQHDNPTPVPTYIPSLETVNPSFYDAPSALLTSLVQAAATHGFALKPLPFAQSPANFILTNISEWNGYPVIRYTNLTNMSVFLSQGVGDFPSVDNFDLIPAEFIQEVTVNGVSGEYVEGAWGVFSVDNLPSDTAIWDDTISDIARVLWREGDCWFNLMVVGPVGSSELITLAESLVVFGQEGAPAGFDASLSLVDFTSRTPQKLPAGFTYSYAQYDKASQNLLLVYTSGNDILAVAEKPSPLEGDASVSYTGCSSSGQEICKAVFWKANGVDLRLYYFQSVSQFDTGVRLQKADLIAIAESMK